jgi:hypothetical protein
LFVDQTSHYIRKGVAPRNDDDDIHSPNGFSPRKPTTPPRGSPRSPGGAPVVRELAAADNEIELEPTPDSGRGSRPAVTYTPPDDGDCGCSKTDGATRRVDDDEQWVGGAEQKVIAGPRTMTGDCSSIRYVRAYESRRFRIDSIG